MSQNIVTITFTDGGHVIAVFFQGASFGLFLFIAAIFHFRVMLIKPAIIGSHQFIKEVFFNLLQSSKQIIAENRITINVF